MYVLISCRRLTLLEWTAPFQMLQDARLAFNWGRGRTRRERRVFAPRDEEDFPGFTAVCSRARGGEQRRERKLEQRDVEIEAWAGRQEAGGRTERRKEAKQAGMMSQSHTSGGYASLPALGRAILRLADPINHCPEVSGSPATQLPCRVGHRQSLLENHYI